MVSFNDIQKWDKHTKTIYLLFSGQIFKLIQFYRDIS